MANSPVAEISQLKPLPIRGSWQLLKFQSKGDERGQLVPIQGALNVPFEIRRVYYLTHTLGDVVRGLHAHTRLDQVLIAVTGSCKIRVDDGNKVEQFALNDCTVGLRITNLVWREMFNFSSDCVLLVLASEHYDVTDYIRDYDQFKAMAQSNQKSF